MKKNLIKPMLFFSKFDVSCTRKGSLLRNVVYSVHEDNENATLLTSLSGVLYGSALFS